jgi:hypothetical protein
LEFGCTLLEQKYNELIGLVEELVARLEIDSSASAHRLLQSPEVVRTKAFIQKARGA